MTGSFPMANDVTRVAGPLSGIRALELAEIWAGPFCGSLLGDLGAEVIKVEAIQRIARGSINPSPGDSSYPDGEPGERPWNRNANFNALSRNKLGITLDLTTRDGAETFRELTNVSDVVFTNYAFGVMDRFGLGYEELRKVKPDIIALFTPDTGTPGLTGGSAAWAWSSTRSAVTRRCGATQTSICHETRLSTTLTQWLELRPPSRSALRSTTGPAREEASSSTCPRPRVLCRILARSSWSTA